jgi:hypothetical protein
METNEDVISQLKFIGKIQKGEKINARRMYVQPNSFLTALSRSFLNQDSRINTFNFISHTIKKSFELLSFHEGSTKGSSKIWRKNIIKDLKESKNGLLNLKDTYSDDVLFCCKIETLLQDVDARLLDMTMTDELIEDPNEIKKEQDKKKGSQTK